ncbi:MAG: PaaI family thioesterase, partial [Oscillospiraceae bacterium]|nr:PaaI family thioesterase [Oscillospiraceae bacterium]
SGEITPIYQPNSLSCFLCGKGNPVSLKVKWLNNYEKDQIETTVVIPHELCSYKGVAHGGIVATLLDETAGRAVMLNNDFDRLMVTMKLETTYRKPTPTGVPVKVIGRVIKDSGSRATVEGKMILPDGTICATCNALLFKMPDNIRSGWDEAESAEWNDTKPNQELADALRKKFLP